MKYNITPYILEVAKELGLDLNKFSSEQLEVILKPIHAPEDLYQDGEISRIEAIRLHNYNLCQVNVNGADRVKALRLI